MKGLILKDYYVSEVWIIVLLTVTFALSLLFNLPVCIFTGEFNAAITAFSSITMYSIFLGWCVFGNNDKNHNINCDRFISTLPVTKKNIVISKYLYALTVGAAVIAIGAVSGILSMLVSGCYDFMNLAYAILLTLGICLSLCAVFCLIGFVLNPGITGVASVLFIMFSNRFIMGDWLSAEKMSSCFVYVLIAGVVFVAISLFITVKVYEKKEL